MSVQRRERSQPRRDRAYNCGVHRAEGDRKRRASGESLEGRDRKKEIALAARRYHSCPGTLNFRVLMGSSALVLVCSQPSEIAVRAYLMSIQHKERSQPRRDRASDCGVRGVGGYRTRGARGERLERRDREK
ncbi:Hypothetical predicted protein [Olea europaea subsp. europaea]|uniref:Uncharacterized protein n=1 Tax=Olea europaea subsp. europaea TaxID=158383 RepID=A0A8S0RRP5_OLEEU|nr:Hypothetical predicted protein [Olea europaea subsp. europaea]